MEAVSRQDQASRHALAAQQAIERSDWAQALEAAGLSILARPDWREPYGLISQVCFLLGDSVMAEAYLRLVRAIVPPVESVLNQSLYSETALQGLVLQWHDEASKAKALQPTARKEATLAGFRLVAGGDVMLGRQMPGWVGLRGSRDPLSEIATLFQAADLALVNLEACVSTEGDFLDKGGRQPYYYHHLPEMLDVLIEAGVDCIATGNNHAMDFGAEALAQQTSILDACGFLHFGAGRHRLEAAMPKYARVRGLTVAFIGIETETPDMMATDETAGIHYAAVNDLARVVAGSIAIARAHADLVIVSPHWGPNWEEAPTPAIQDAARLLIDLGADAVLGHSAHLLQGVMFHAGRPIVYDMGTLLFDRVTQSSMKDSALFDLTWDGQRGCTLTIRPVKLRTARARWADGDDFDRICALLSRLSTSLDASANIQNTEYGLHFSGQPAPSPIRQIARQAPHSTCLPDATPLVPAYLRNLKSKLVFKTLPNLDPAWPTPLIVNQNLHILGARFATPVRAGRGFVCEVYFRSKPPGPTSRVEARIAGLTAEGEEAFAYTHPVAEGIHPPARWRYDEIICDRVAVRPVKVVPDGVYQLCWSLVDLEGSAAMPIEGTHDRFLKGQIVIGHLVVSAAAPNGVAGISTPLRLPCMDNPKPARFGGWQGRLNDFWATEASPWVHQELKKIGLVPLSPEPILVRDAPLVLVLRIETQQGAYFFKALEASNHFEPALVALLAKRWSDRIASPLATDIARGWMLMPDFGVELLKVGDQATRAAALEGMAAQLAEIQIESCSQVEQLLALGVPDRRLSILPGLFEQLLADSQALSLDQATGLQSAELAQARALLPLLRECCQSLTQEPCAAGLDHGDLHFGNLLVKNEQVVLFDWDTSWVTHPFCSLLLPYHASGLRDAAALHSMSRLNSAYLMPWVKKTGRSMQDLTVRLHQAIWVAHVKRAIFWSVDPATDEDMPTGEMQPQVARWIRLWIMRTPLLIQYNTVNKPIMPLPSASKNRPSTLATADNPLLLDIKKIADITGGIWTNVPNDVLFTGISFNRDYMLEGSSGNLYFAVKSDPRDDSFDAESIASVHKAFKAGALAVVVPDRAEGVPDELAVLRVPNLMTALDQLGIHVRDHLFTGKRLLVSGTEGKTGFKTMLHHVLSPQISTHATLNSSNLGFSIMASLASIRQQDQVAILEAAGTQPGRLAQRSGYVRPHLFVLTEVGNEHINFHGSQQAVIESKADIVTGLVDGGYGLINADSRNYSATRQAILSRKRVPLALFGSSRHCNGRLLERQFANNAWLVKADIEGHLLEYSLPLLGDHAPLASVSVLLAAYYLGADVAQAAADFHGFRPYESQGVLRRLKHRGGEITCYDNASRASVLSYQSTLGMAARLTAPGPKGKKVAVIGQMIFLGAESETWHAQLAQWVDAAGFDRIILVGQYTEVTFAHLRQPAAVIHRFPDYDRRTSGKKELQALIDAVEAACHPGDLLFIKGEVDELGAYLRSKELAPDTPPAVYALTRRDASAPTADASVLKGLRPLQLSDLPLYRAVIDQTRRTTWQHYFALIYLLGRSPGYRFLVEEDAGSFCIYLLREKKNGSSLNVFLLPMPMQPAVLERCIERVKAFDSSDRASLFRVDADDVDLFRGRSNTRIVACPKEYIYSPAKYLDLSGNKNGNLRRAIERIAKREDIEVLDYKTSDAQDCKQVLDQWAALQREKYGSVLYGSYTRACLDVYDQFPRSDLFGKVVRLGGKICSFGFAGEMRQNMGNLFIAYSDLHIDGLNRFLWYRLLRDMEHLEFVNGGNAGDTPGLAFAKQSLRPVSLFQPYQVYAA